MSIILYGVYLFAFILCCLIVLKNLYSTIKVLAMKKGKIGSISLNSWIFMSSLSFVITALIIGF